MLPFGSVTVPNWDGTDDDIDFGTIPFLSDFSLVAWINVANAGSPGYRSAIRTGEVFGTNANFVFGWRLNVGPNYSLFCYARNAGTLKGAEFAASLTVGWHRVGVSWTSGTQRYFVDGKLLGTGSSTNGADGSVALSFGGLGDSSNGIRINRPTSDCRVYNRVLTDGEFYADFRNTNRIYLPRDKPLFWFQNSVANTAALSNNLATTASGILVPSLGIALSNNLITSATGTPTPVISKALTNNLATSANGILIAGVTIALTNNLATSATGALGTVAALSNNLVTSATGTLTPVISQALSNNLATTATGSLGTTAALANNLATTATGNLTPSVSKALTSNLATSATGELAATLSITLTNNLATADIGVLSPAGNYSAALSNNLATTASGSLTPVITASVNNNLASTATGTPTSNLALALVNNALAADVGAIAAGVSLTLANNLAVTATGDLAVFSGATLTNNLVTTSPGLLTPKISRALSGVAATAVEGAVGITGYNAVVALSGQMANAQAGLLSVFAPNEIVALNSPLTLSVGMDSFLAPSIDLQSRIFT